MWAVEGHPRRLVDRVSIWFQVAFCDYSIRLSIVPVGCTLGVTMGRSRKAGRRTTFSSRRSPMCAHGPRSVFLTAIQFSYQLSAIREPTANLECHAHNLSGGKPSRAEEGRAGRCEERMNKQ